MIKFASTHTHTNIDLTNSNLHIHSLASVQSVNHAAEDAKLQKGTQFFQEQKYKQHHHPVHTTRSKYEKPTYLDTLPINEEAKHDTPTRYLDTLTDAKRSTWDVYKHQLDEVKPLNEVDGKSMRRYYF